MTAQLDAPDQAPMEPGWPSSRLVLAGVGALAGAAGIAAGHLAGALTEPEASPLIAVGSTVIDLTPTPVKEWAVSVFGTADKPILLGIVAVVAIGLCVTAGLVSRRLPSAANGIFIGLGIVVMAAAMSRPVATVISLLPGLIAAIVGIAVLRWLLGRLPDDAPSPRPRWSSDTLIDADRPIARPKGEPSRRGFLLGGAAVLGAGAVAATIGEVVIRQSLGATDIDLPPVADPLDGLPKGLETSIDGISPLVTPNADFYRIDTALTVPSISTDEWQLTIDGDVAESVTLTYADLKKFELIERDTTMCCVSNDVGGPYIGSARWLGVRTSEILALAGIRPGVDQILSTDVAGMTISTPIQALTDGREALLAIGMNGEPLPRAHGFPARLVTPGLYGFVGSTKWVTRLTATTYAKDSAYWTDRDWVIDAPVLTQSRIDTPSSGADLSAGRETHIGGVAWAQGRGISKVEVRVDDGDWQEATLGPDVGIDYWVQWYLKWTPKKGDHKLSVRATDRTGQTQTDAVAPPFPSGATGYHSVKVSAD